MKVVARLNYIKAAIQKAQKADMKHIANTIWHKS